MELLVILSVVTLGVILWRKRKKDECPKLILGYNRCNRWDGQECDHSPEAVQSAKETMQSGKKPSGDRLFVGDAERSAKPTTKSRRKA